jgi:hypothetical protein
MTRRRKKTPTRIDRTDRSSIVREEQGNVPDGRCCFRFCEGFVQETARSSNIEQRIVQRWRKPTIEPVKRRSNWAYRRITSAGCVRAGSSMRSCHPTSFSRSASKCFNLEPAHDHTEIICLGRLTTSRVKPMFHLQRSPGCRHSSAEPGLLTPCFLAIAAGSRPGLNGVRLGLIAIASGGFVTVRAASRSGLSVSPLDIRWSICC